LKIAMRFITFSLVALLTAVTASAAWPDELSEAFGVLPVTIGGNTVELDGMVVKQADAQGRLPVAVFTNGGNVPTAGLNITAKDYAPLARDLARRGWLAVVAMRRGYGQSQGPKPLLMKCDAAEFDAWAGMAADDLQAVMKFVAQRPDADSNRVIVIGPASGGVAAIALSARNPRGLRAVITVSAGVKSEAGCPMAEILSAAFRNYGTSSRVPNLWIYGASDPVFDPALADRMHTSFLDGGGDTKFVMLHDDDDGGNAIYTKRRRSWFLQMDGFLRTLQLPTWTQADAFAVAKKLNYADTPRLLLDGYFPAPGAKALAHSTATQFASGNATIFLWTGVMTMEEARKKALEQCQKTAPPPCLIVMENDHLVDDVR
jgi:dienelactone hydrolase